jgi:hypothetical protein
MNIDDDNNAGQKGSGRDLVVFLVWRSLPYTVRLVLSGFLIVCGLAIQAATNSFLLGAVPIILGNLILLVRGYDNRVDLKHFSPGASWEKVERSKLDEILTLDESIRRWDRSVIDISNLSGAVLFLVIAAGLGLAAFFLSGFGRILALDAMVMLLPHWVTGIRSILRLPEVVVRAETLANVLSSSADLVSDDQVDIMMLLKGKDVQVPDDIKFRLSFPGQDPDFLGLYGQVVINTVQGKSYPYFYVVMVARKGYGLDAACKEFKESGNVTKKFDTEDEVEFIVIRQTTTSTSGYHTKPGDAIAIFVSGYSLARSVAKS